MRKLNFFNLNMEDISTFNEQQSAAFQNIPADRLEERLSFWMLHSAMAEGRKLTVPQTLELCEIIDVANRAGILPLAAQGKLRSLVWSSAEDDGACYYDNRSFYTLLRKIYVGIYSI